MSVATKYKIKFLCPVCHKEITVDVEKEKILKDPSGVLSLPLLHKTRDYPPHLIVVSIDQHGAVRGAYLYKELISVGETEEKTELSNLERLLSDVNNDAELLIKSQQYDPLRDIPKIITAFQLKYKEDIFLHTLGIKLIDHLLKIGKIKIKDPKAYIPVEILKKIIIPILKKLGVRAEMYSGLEDTIVINASPYPIEFVRGIIEGLILKVEEKANYHLILETESINPILFSLRIA